MKTDFKIYHILVAGLAFQVFASTGAIAQDTAKAVEESETGDKTDNEKQIVKGIRFDSTVFETWDSYLLWASLGETRLRLDSYHFLTHRRWETYVAPEGQLPELEIPDTLRR